jgi:hypothetical protein
MGSPAKGVFRVIRFSAESGRSEELETTFDLDAAVLAAGEARTRPGEFVMIEAVPVG